MSSRESISSIAVFLCQQNEMLDQADHQGLLIRQAFRYQQGQCYQGVVVDQVFHRPCQQGGVTAQIPQEQEGAAALVAVGQRVILDHEVEQVSGTGGHVRVKELITKALLDSRQCRSQAVTPQLAEQRGGLALGHQGLLELADGLECLVQCQRLHVRLPDADLSQLLLIVALQQAPGAGVVADHPGDGFALPGDEALMGQGAAQQVDGLLELDAALRQAALIEGVALNQVILQHPGGPLAKLHTTLGLHAVANGNNNVQ